MASIGLPSWAIAVIVILLSIMCIAAVFYMLRKRLRKRGSVGTDSVQEKNSITYPAARPLMQSTSTIKDSHFSSIVLNSTVTPIPSPPESPYLSRPSRTHQEEKKLNRYHDAIPSPVASIPVKEDDSRSVWTEDIPLQSPDAKTSLPHPTSSFFADKMELDSDEAHDLYASYMNVSQHEFMALDDNKNFYSSAAANIQQKAATIRNTLRQSMRRKSNANKPAPLSQFFDKDRPDNNNKQQQSSRFPNSSSSLQTTSLISLLPPSPRPDSPLADNHTMRSRNKSLVSVATSVATKDEDDAHSTKIMIDHIPPESYFSLPVSPSTPSPLGVKQQQLPPVPSPPPTIATSSIDIVKSPLEKSIQDDDKPVLEKEEAKEEVEKEDEPQANEEAAATAARRIIRSASKKSRTRSTAPEVVENEKESAEAMFSLMATTRDVSKYATMRNKAVNDNITAGSVRYRNENRPSTLDIRNWTSDAPPSHTVKTSPRRTVLSSTISGSATVSGRKRLPPTLDTMPSSEQGGESRSATISRSFRFPSTEDEEENQNRTSYLSTSTVQSAIKIQDDMQDNNRVMNSHISNQSLNDSIVFSSKRSSQVSAIPLESPMSSRNNTMVGNNMDAIRKMLQSSWSNNNLKESSSNNSLASSSGSIRPIGSSPLGSVNPRLQNQHLVSLSLKAAANRRPAMPIDFMNNEEIGPEPTVSFSSSTVRTMIPAEEVEEHSRQKTGSRRAHPPSKLGEVKGGKTPAQKEREKYLKSLNA